MPRTERISIGVVHEIFSEKSGQHDLVYEETSSQKGDMFTKILDPNAFERALTLINLVRPDGSKYNAEWVTRVSGLAACLERLEALVRPARPRAPRPPWT